MSNLNVPITEPAHLQLVNVSVAYNHHPVLEELTFSVAHGSQVAIVGPNGAGKSTLFKTLVGLLPICGGEILIHGLPLGHHQDCVAYVPQREEVDWRFPVTVTDVVMMGRFRRQGWLNRPSEADYHVVSQSIAYMGISDLANQPIGALSGGQQQRVFLARALAQEPHILLLDEPFTGIDIPTQETTLTLLEQLKKQNVSVLISTHDLNMAAQRFDLVLLLNHHLVAFGTPKDVLTQTTLKASFGEMLLVLKDEHQGSNTMVVDQCCPPATKGIK